MLQIDPDDRPALWRALVRTARGLTGVLAIVCSASCTYTVAGDAPAPTEPPRPAFQPSVEHTVAEFSFALGGGDMAPSIFDGRQLSNEIMTAWQERGYVRTQEYVADGSFSGTADYHLTLRGSQRGETSFTMQVINALTLSLVPYTVTQRYEFHYVLEDVHSSAQYSATVHAWDKTWVEPLLVLALPFAERGHRTTMGRVGDDLYEQFRRQGAFTAGPAVSAPRSTPRRRAAAF
jgi:hypothetical protein